MPLTTEPPLQPLACGLVCYQDSFGSPGPTLSCSKDWGPQGAMMVPRSVPSQGRVDGQNSLLYPRTPTFPASVKGDSEVTLHS